MANTKHSQVFISTNNLVEHVSYWGEPRPVLAGMGGKFTGSFNVNDEYELVGSGPDAAEETIKRVPVEGQKDCDTSKSIVDNSVKLVTVEGGEINKSCAEDIARIVNRNSGKIIVFGLESDSHDLILLAAELKTKQLYQCPGYILPKSIQGLSSFNKYMAFLNLTELMEQLSNHIKSGAYIDAVDLTKILHENNYSMQVVEVVKKLIQDGSNNIMNYTYKVYHSRAKDLVVKFFPLQLKLIFNEDHVKIISKKFDMPLKLDANVDFYNDRLAWGTNQDRTTGRVIWQMLPYWSNDEVFFKIKNIEHNMFLKLDSSTDSYGDRKCWGSSSSNEERHKWSLRPAKVDDEILFFIVNHYYDQGLKLDTNVDSYGDRILWGNNGRVFNRPDMYGWKIKPFH